MRKLFLRIGVGFVTFVVGISAVFVTSKLSTPENEAAPNYDPVYNAENETVLIVEPVYKAETGISRFTPYGRGCGNGYAQSYTTDDGQFVDEGVAAGYYPKEIRRDLRKWVRDAKQVIERVPKFRNSLEEVGERIIIVNKPNKEGKESVSILFYDGGDSCRFIDAPTLDLALEFEQYLISIKFRSPV